MSQTDTYHFLSELHHVSLFYPSKRAIHLKVHILSIPRQRKKPLITNNGISTSTYATKSLCYELNLECSIETLNLTVCILSKYTAFASDCEGIIASWSWLS